MEKPPPAPVAAHSPSRRRVLAIPGSLRRGSYNRMLLTAAVELAPASLDLDIEDRLAEIPLFDEDLEAATGGGPEPVLRLRRRVAAADGLLIATPEYNHSIPGVLKNLVDWLSRPDGASVLAGKPVAVLGATPGTWGTRLAQATLRQVLVAADSVVLPSPTLYVGRVGGRVDEVGRLVERATREQLAALLSAFADWISRVGASSPPAGDARRGEIVGAGD